MDQIMKQARLMKAAPDEGEMALVNAQALRELGVDDALLERIARLVQRQSLLHRRLMAAFPHMQFPRSPASLEALWAAWDRLRRPRKKK